MAGPLKIMDEDILVAIQQARRGMGTVELSAEDYGELGASLADQGRRYIACTYYLLAAAHALPDEEAEEYLELSRGMLLRARQQQVREFSP